jgi:hypothetical protein
MTVTQGEGGEFEPLVSTIIPREDNLRYEYVCYQGRGTAQEVYLPRVQAGIRITSTIQVSDKPSREFSVSEPACQ